MPRAAAKVAVLTAAVLAGASVTTPTALSAPPPPSATVYVSPTGGGATGDNPSCGSAGYSTIQSAIDAAPFGGTVVVCAGTYKESVNISKRLTVHGEAGAVVDATGQAYGVGIGADFVTVSGLTVENADAKDGPADGIITAVLTGSSPQVGNEATIVNNVVRGNGGAGIDLNSTVGSVAAHNATSNNGVGINVVNDFGKAATNNTVLGNTASDNPGGCGIVLADHSGQGVFNNVVVGNAADRNGLGTPSAPSASSGSGLILAGGPTGGVHDNVVTGNEFVGNGHGGVTLHAHKAGANFNGNSIVGNLIGTNNVRTDYADRDTTAVYLGSADKLDIVVTNNFLRDDTVGIFTAGPVTVRGVNAFRHVLTAVRHVASYGG